MGDERPTYVGGCRHPVNGEDSSEMVRKIPNKFQSNRTVCQTQLRPNRFRGLAEFHPICRLTDVVGGLGYWTYTTPTKLTEWLFVGGRGS